MGSPGRLARLRGDFPAVSRCHIFIADGLAESVACGCDDRYCHFKVMAITTSREYGTPNAAFMLRVVPRYPPRQYDVGGEQTHHGQGDKLPIILRLVNTDILVPLVARSMRVISLNANHTRARVISRDHINRLFEFREVISCGHHSKLGFVRSKHSWSA